MISAPTIAAKSPEADAQRSEADAEDLKRKAWPRSKKTSRKIDGFFTLRRRPK